MRRLVASRYCFSFLVMPLYGIAKRKFRLCEDMRVFFMSCSRVFFSRHDGIALLLRLQHAGKCLPVFRKQVQGYVGNTRENM